MVTHLVGKSMSQFYLQQRGLDSSLLTIGDFGKPELPNCSFNISHTDTLVVGAFCDEPSVQLGIDLLEISRWSDAVVSKRFTRAEQEMTVENRGNFGKIWTAKEAYLKSVGMGIQFGLERVEVVRD